MHMTDKKLCKDCDLLEQQVIKQTRKIAQLKRAIASDIAKRKKIENELLAHENELARRTVKLEELNITLRTLLEQRDVDRKDLERRIVTNINELIMPYIERLKICTMLSNHDVALIENLQDNIQTLTSPFLGSIRENTYLSTTERQIADLIRHGKRSKQIGTIMKLSSGTVDCHRNNIRKKLGIRGKKISLQEYLLKHS